jgi:MFS family permease
VLSRSTSIWFTVALLWVAFLLNYIDRQMIFSIFPVLAHEMNMSDLQVGLIGTVFTWSYCVSMPLAGRVADLLPRQRLIVASLLLWSCATLGTGLSRSGSVLLFWRGAMGITESLFMPAALSLIATVHAGATRSRALALFATAQFAGIFAGGWYGGWMADNLGWRVGCTVLSALGICYAVMLSMALPRPKATARAQSGASVLAVFQSRCVLALCAAFFVFCAMLWILLAWLANFIHNRYHLSLTESGWTATVFLQTGSAIGVLCGGVLGDRIARRIGPGRFYVAIFGLLCCSPFAWAMLSGNSLAALELCASGFGLFGGLFIANVYASAYDVIAQQNYGFAAGLMNMIGGFAAGAAILLTGLLQKSFGTAFVIRMFALSAVIAAGVLAAVVLSQFAKDQENLVIHAQAPKSA